MSSKTARVTVIFKEDAAGLLASLAEQEGRSISSLANELILEALERREDRALSAIAESRERKTQKTIKHSDAWK